VSKLERLFREHGIRYWYSTRHIVAATKWHDEIGRALDRCDWFALVLSPSAVRSAWVKRELLYALESRRYRDRIVPILHKNCVWNPALLDARKPADRGFQFGFSGGVPCAASDLGSGLPGGKAFKGSVEGEIGPKTQVNSAPDPYVSRFRCVVKTGTKTGWAGFAILAASWLLGAVILSGPAVITLGIIAGRTSSKWWHLVAGAGLLTAAVLVASIAV